MGLIDAVMNGINSLATRSIADGWKNTLQEDGIEMLRTEIRKFLKSSMSHTQDEIIVILINDLRKPQNEESKELFRTVYDVYFEELLRKD